MKLAASPYQSLSQQQIENLLGLAALLHPEMKGKITAKLGPGELDAAIQRIQRCGWTMSFSFGGAFGL
jgi:hypothetical protein